MAMMAPVASVAMVALVMMVAMGGYGGYGGYGGDDDGVLSTEDFGFHFPILENPSLGPFRGAAQYIFWFILLLVGPLP